MFDSSAVLDFDFLLIAPDLSKTQFYIPIVPNAVLLEWSGIADEVAQMQSVEATLSKSGSDIVAIVHRPPLDTLKLVKQVRNLSRGSELYIVIIVPSDVTQPLGETAEVDDFLYLSEANVDQLELQRCLSRYNRNLEIRNEFVTATRTAVNAIESASEYGSLIHFFEASESCNSLAELKEVIADFLLTRNLAIDFIIGNQEDSLYWISDTNARNHRFMLERMRSSKKRMVVVDKLLGFNFDHFTLLVSNAPHQQPEKYGQLKDTLAHFCTIAESRMKSILIRDNIASQHNELLEIMEMIRVSSRDSKHHISNIMKNLVTDIEIAARTFDMNLYEEEKLLDVANTAASSLWGFHDNNQLLESHFFSLVETISEMKKLACTPQTVPAQVDNIELF